MEQEAEQILREKRSLLVRAAERLARSGVPVEKLLEEAGFASEEINGKGADPTLLLAMVKVINEQEASKDSVH